MPACGFGTWPSGRSSCSLASSSSLQVGTSFYYTPPASAHFYFCIFVFLAGTRVLFSSYISHRIRSAHLNNHFLRPRKIFRSSMSDNGNVQHPQPFQQATIDKISAEVERFRRTQCTEEDTINIISEIIYINGPVAGIEISKCRSACKSYCTISTPSSVTRHRDPLGELHMAEGHRSQAAVN